MSSSDFMMDPGNLSIAEPYWIAGKSGALTVPAAGNPVATLQQLGRIDGQTGLLLNVPIRVSQVRAGFSMASGTTLALAIELYKVTIATQRNVGGVVKTPTPRKTTDHRGRARAITAAETNLYMADTGATSGGSVAVQGDPFAVFIVPNLAANAPGEAVPVWIPSDLYPLSLEVGEGIEARVAQQGAAVGILWLVFDFLRQ